MDTTRHTQVRATCCGWVGGVWWVGGLVAWLAYGWFAKKSIVAANCIRNANKWQQCLVANARAAAPGG